MIRHRRSFWTRLDKPYNKLRYHLGKTLDWNNHHRRIVMMNCSIAETRKREFILVLIFLGTPNRQANNCSNSSLHWGQRGQEHHDRRNRLEEQETRDQNTILVMWWADNSLQGRSLVLIFVHGRLLSNAIVHTWMCIWLWGNYLIHLPQWERWWWFVSNIAI